MQYDFECGECGEVTSKDLSFDEFEDYEEEGLDCKSCGGHAEFTLNTEGMEFQFKGMAWADKNYREKKYRKNRSEYLKKRQHEVHETPELKPNYQGEELGSWREAQEAAKKDNQDVATVASYEPKVQKEAEEDS